MGGQDSPDIDGGSMCGHFCLRRGVGVKIVVYGVRKRVKIDFYKSYLRGPQFDPPLVVTNMGSERVNMGSGFVDRLSHLLCSATLITVHKIEL